MDIRIDNPVGRVPDPHHVTARELRCTPCGWSLGRRHGPWNGSLQSTLSSLDETHELRVQDEGVPSQPAAGLAGYLQRVIARGTYVCGVVGPELLRAIRTAGGPEITAVAGDRPGDLSWDIRSVVQRRAVLQPMFRRWPTVSLVVVSRRADLVRPLIARLARVDYPELELVVGVHGGSVPEGLKDAAGSRPIVVQEFPADQVFGSVLQDAFAAASGELVAKVDDDDYMSDAHIRDLVMAHGYSGATLVGKSTTVVYLGDIDTTVRRLYGARESFTHRVAGSTFLLSPEDLAAVGGWEPLPRAVDTALLSAVRRHGGSIYQPHDIGYLYMRRADPSEHTWATGSDHFLRNTREQWVGLMRHPEFGTEGDL